MACLVAALVLPASAAWAHGELEAGSPGPGDDVATGSQTVQLEYADLDPAGRTLVALVDDSGAAVAVGEPVVLEGNIVCARSAPLSPGVHALEYAVTSADGHAVSGRYEFEVSGTGEPVAAPACLTADLAAPGEAQTLAEMTTDDFPWWVVYVLASLAVLTGVGAAAAVARERRASPPAPSP